MIQLLILHRQVNETVVILLHQNQYEGEILYGSFCRRAQLDNSVEKKKTVSRRMGRILWGCQLWGFLYTTVKLWVFSVMYTSFNNELTSPRSPR